MQSHFGYVFCYWVERSNIQCLLNYLSHQMKVVICVTGNDETVSWDKDRNTTVLLLNRMSSWLDFPCKIMLCEHQTFLDVTLQSCELRFVHGHQKHIAGVSWRQIGSGLTQRLWQCKRGAVTQNCDPALMWLICGYAHTQDVPIRRTKTGTNPYSANKQKL